MVLRHELGHSLIDVGEEYEGGKTYSTTWPRLMLGEVYSGVNADTPEHLDRLKWKDLLSDPGNVRIEDAKVPLQTYP